MPPAFALLRIGMKKKSKLNALIWILVIILLAVVALVIYKQWEYGQSADYYSSLRGRKQPLSWLIASACAEETIVQDREALHELVAGMFAAATGTTEADEIAARENMTEEEEALRNAESKKIGLAKKNGASESEVSAIMEAMRMIGDEIAAIMARLPGWERPANATMRIKDYGKQRVFIRSGNGNEGPGTSK